MSKGYTYEPGGEAKKRRALGIKPGEGQTPPLRVGSRSRRAAKQGRPIDRNGQLIDLAKEPKGSGARRSLRGPAVAPAEKTTRREDYAAERSARKARRSRGQAK